jgi:membrane-bound lytic murein transglycosylase B
MKRQLVPLLLLPLLFKLAAAPQADPHQPPASTLPPVPHRSFTGQEQDSLRHRLARAGLEAELVAGLRLDTMRCYPGRLLLKLSYGESSGDYSHFFTEATVDRLRRFLRDERDLLAAAEHRHGVPREVIAAILMIETRLGEHQGHYRAPDLFMTLLLQEEALSPVALDTAEAREQRFGGTRSRRELAEVLEKRAAKRAAWAARELRTLARSIPVVDWHDLPCSFAGAIGLPQFMPTSLAAYGDDGDGDGHVALGGFPDAVFSVGRYLRENGWRGKLTEHKRRKAIHRYNHCWDYVDAVLRLARTVGWES